MIPFKSILAGALLMLWAFYVTADATGVGQIHRVNLPNDFVKKHAHLDIKKRNLKNMLETETPLDDLTQDVCKKDILILLDTSASLGHHFENDVKPFLKSLIESPKLNVGPDGTQLALVTFSDERGTGLKFGFSDKTTQTYLDYVDENLIFRQIYGTQTMTGAAMKIAAQTVFPLESPLNARREVADVVLLFTDGEPNGPNNELENALKYSSSMKNRSILIVGIAVGKPSVVNKYKHTILQMATSSSTLFSSDFDDLDKILDQLVDASCIPFKPGDCECRPKSQSQDVYIKPPRSTVDVSWIKPTLQCRDNRVPTSVSSTVNPNIVSPYAFVVGDHDIEYTYTFRGGFDLKCYVKIAVKSCTCPSSPPVIAYVSSDLGSATAQWEAPVPSCSATLTDIQPNKPSGSSFGFGSHTVNYVYSTVAGFDLTCGINIDVRKCSCQNTTKSVYMRPDSPNYEMSVSWVEPKPNCPDQKISETSINPPNAQPGDSFGIGSHTVRYSFLMSSGTQVQCSAEIEVKVVPCGGANYDPATQICCCGEVKIKTPNHECCGRKTYDTQDSKCCPLNFNIVKKGDPCPAHEGDVSV